ncbi:MAG: DMT family transporter [Lachnospiraceae bacterium]|nr:DMT family transporter [Lachnospiraceae bacterium]
MAQQSYRKGLLLSSFGATCWGFSGCLGQYLFMNYNLDAAWLTMVRMLVSGFFLLLFTLFRKKKQAFAIFKNKGDTLRLVLFAILGLLFCQYSYLSAIKYSNSGTATILQTLSVIIAPILLCITQKKKPEIKEICCILLALAGVFLIATHGNPAKMALSKSGLFWGICAAIGAVFYSTLSEDIVKKWGSPAVTGYGMLIGGLFFTLLARPWNAYVPIDFKAIIALALTIFLGTIGAFLCFLKGISSIGPDKALLVGTLEPVSATIISFFWLHTSFTVADIIGFLCILGTVVILTCFEKKESKSVPTSNPSCE